MRRWIAATLLCLLSLALPLQGLAAATTVPAAAAAAPAHAPAGIVVPAAGEHPCHASAAADDAATPAHGGCTECAACHGGSAPAPRAQPAAGLAAGTDAPPAWRAPEIAAVDPEGPHRPPRPPLVRV